MRRANVSKVLLVLSKRVIRGSEVPEGRLHTSSIRCLVHLSSRGIDVDGRAYHVEAGAVQYEVGGKEGADDRLRPLKPPEGGKIVSWIREEARSS